jgi:hypothetical protein
MVALVSGGEPDAKQAVEIGFMMLLDKPLIIAVTPGSVVPEKLARAADAIVEVDLLDPAAGQQAIQRAIDEILEREGNAPSETS